MATGMVLVIVTRNIDLSIGSMLGFIGMVMGVIADRPAAEILRFRTSGDMGRWRSQPDLYSASCSARSRASSSPIWAFPSFIVTLGGLLVWRGAAWWVTAGQTVAPLDDTFRLMGGGPEGSIGAAWSLGVGVVACAGDRAAAWRMAARGANNSASRCVRWPPKFLSAAMACAAIVGRGRRRQCLSVAGRHACAATPRPNTSRFPTAGCSSRTASPFRC